MNVVGLNDLPASPSKLEVSGIVDWERAMGKRAAQAAVIPIHAPLSP
jgi:hypothetical protein